MLTYNRAPFIREAVESALAQSYENFELIILDDGSTDNTFEIVSQFTDPRIRYIRDTENKGLAARRTESLSYPKGKYVAILDSDDVWTDTEKLAIQVGYLEQFPTCAVVGTFITLIDKDGTVTGNNHYETTDAAIRKKILFRNQFTNSSVVMRKAHLDQTEGYRAYAPAEDLELFLQLGRVGTFANIPEYTTQYRVHAGGSSYKKAIVAKMVKKIIRRHRDYYSGALWGLAKMHALHLLARSKSLLGR